jgi:O-antigen ligase
MIRRIGAILLLVPLLSALSSPAIPPVFRILLVALWVTAAARPHWAIGALIALVPFASWLLLITASPPVRLAEALVLATLAGVLAGRAPHRRLRSQSPQLAPAAALFAAVIVASAATTLVVMQTGTAVPWSSIRHVLVFLTHDYLIAPPAGFPGIADAALLLEGLALALIVDRHAREHVARPGALLTTLAMALGAAALLTVAASIGDAAAAHSAADAVRVLFKSRISVHVTDLNAAGSTFAMAACLAAALAMNTRRTHTWRRPNLVRGAWTAAATLLVLAVWLTGSRMAILAVIAGLALTVLWTRLRDAPRWPLQAAAAVAAVALIAALGLALDPRPSASRTAAHMLTMRADFMVTGLRMMRSAPIFGVGVGRYFERSGEFMPASIYWFYFHENAHNNFLQVGGELGLVGLGAFVWLLVSAAIRLVRGLRADPGDRLLLGATAGLAAFTATWMTSHPLLVQEVAFPFWILIGIALARADGNVNPAPAARRFRPVTVLAIVAIAALAVSVPLRAAQAVRDMDLTKQSWGFYDWEGQGPERNRWTTRRATFFIPAGAREITLPVRAMHIGTHNDPTAVSIDIGGRPFHHLVLTTGDWVDIRLRLPPPSGSSSAQRIDITVDPTWSPAVLFGGRSDVRILGVQVAEPRLAF